METTWTLGNKNDWFYAHPNSWSSYLIHNAGKTVSRETAEAIIELLNTRLDEIIESVPVTCGEPTNTERAVAFHFGRFGAYTARPTPAPAPQARQPKAAKAPARKCIDCGAPATMSASLGPTCDKCYDDFSG